MSLSIDTKIPEDCTEITFQQWHEALHSGANCFDKDLKVFYVTDTRNSKERIADERAWRDSELQRTYKYMTLDYPLGDAEREAVRAYRQALRDYPRHKPIDDWRRPDAPL
nr:phage tail assembly chaperone [Pleionea sp. CnH1-48]